MKRIFIIFFAVVVALLGSSGAANAKPADTTGDTGAAAVVNCQHSDGNGSVVSAAYVKRYDGVILGAIQLCKDSSSGYWAYVIFYNPVPSGHWGYAFLHRYLDGQYVDSFGCNSPGGNGYVAPGQTRCWTPKIDAPSSRVTFVARGILCVGTFNRCDFLVGEGQTARTR